MRNKAEQDAWQDQLARRITTREELETHIELRAEERDALIDGAPLPFAITPYYATLLRHEAIRRSVVPTVHECAPDAGGLVDPLGEEAHQVAPNLIHTYPDKVLLLATPFCSTYCRYCTRARWVGAAPAAETFDMAFAYIASHPQIRDVLVSGGDPLTLSDARLGELLARLRTIPHIRTIRVGSKVPAVLPMRITKALCLLLRRHRVWLSLHFTHPAELTPETQAACRRLADHGIGMVSQTVLLKGVNNDAAVLSELFYGLLEAGVKPYYLLQCDPVRGADRFRTTVEEGIELIRALQGRLCGLAVPQYVVDAPGGGGKVPLLDRAQIQRDGDGVRFINYEGRAYRYPDPPEVQNV